MHSYLNIFFCFIGNFSKGSSLVVLFLRVGPSVFPFKVDFVCFFSVKDVYIHILCSFHISFLFRNFDLSFPVLRSSGFRCQSFIHQYLFTIKHIQTHICSHSVCVCAHAHVHISYYSFSSFADLSSSFSSFHSFMKVLFKP